jgi:3-dehydroquinate synthase
LKKRTDKTAVVVNDEFEKERKLLNFGQHPWLIENLYELPHGHAVSIGMMTACSLSESINQFPVADTKKITKVLEKYHLPTQLTFDKQKIWEVLGMDKKRLGNSMNFIVLNKIGEAFIQPIEMNELENLI